MAESINPGNWKDIFSDTLYIITDPNAVVAPTVEAVKEVVKTASVEIPKAVEVPKEVVTVTEIGRAHV